MKRKYVSFDVFDSCLIRRCGRPEKIWDLMAKRLFEKDDTRGLLSFTGNRSLAEEKASLNNPIPTLKDIYDEMNVSQWGFKQDDVMNLEMEIEEQELFSNPEILKLVNGCREKNFSITFISDMYLPTEFIKKILIKYNFCKENENVFVSADCKATKYGGKLFDYVFEKTGTKAKQWIHYGDNYRSDYCVPKSKGIKANLVSNTDFTDEEKRWLDNACFYPHKNEIELWAGLCRLTRLQNEKCFAATMAVDFIASIYVPYVVYVLRTAKEKGIKTLYFLARDAHIFLEIAKTLKKESEGIECRYLKLNRRVLYPCAFYNVDDNELDLVVNNVRYHTVANALKYIGIEYATLSDSTRKKIKPDFSLNGKNQRHKFAATLKENDAALIKRNSKEKREVLLQYLRQEGFFNQKSAMIDLGWVGSCRCIVNYILRNEGFESVPTFYFGYNRELVYGNADDLLFIYNKQYEISKNSCAYLFFEQYASINSNGSTIELKKECDKIIPVESEKNAPAKSLTAVNESLVNAFGKNFNTMNLVSSGALDDIFSLCGLSYLSRILSTPLGKYIEFFKMIYFENYDIEEKMVRKLPLKDVLALCVWGIPASMIWTEAAIKVTFGPFAGIFTKLYGYTSKTAIANRLRLWWENRE